METQIQLVFILAGLPVAAVGGMLLGMWAKKRADHGNYKTYLVYEEEGK